MKIKKIILISLLAMIIFFVGCVLFTPVSVDQNKPSVKTTLWKTLMEK